MNIIIVGVGKIGAKLVELLSYEEHHNITAIDTRRFVVEDVVNTYDVKGVVGNGASIETLREAGIEDTDILIAVTGSDELNLLTCLIARKSGNCSTIARVRNPEYGKEVQLFKEDLGLAMIINPELTTAMEIAKVLRFPSAIQIDTFAKGRVEILKFKIPEDSVLVNLKLMDLSQKLNCDVLVCGVQRNDETIIPGGDFCLEAGDLVSVVASVRNASQFIKTVGLKTNRVKDAMIVGGGTTAVYLSNILIKSGISVKIIEQDPKRCDLLCELLPKATIINGDGTENRLLLEEGVESAESFVALTGIDEENIMLSMYAQKQGKGKVITKINRISYGEIIDNLGLDTIIHPKDIAAEYVLRFVRAKHNSIGSNIETMHYILDGSAEALEFRIREKSPLAGKTIESLSLKSGILIACITRNGKIITPRGKDVILPDDTVIIVTTHRGFQDINDILK